MRFFDKRAEVPKLLKFLVGFIIIFIILSIFQGPSGALTMLMLSIVCTAGVGLAAWIPLSYAAGAIFFRILRATPSYKNRYEIATQPQVKALIASSNDQHALTDYIRKVRAVGQNDAQASAALKAAGWREETISDALKVLNG